MKKAKRCATPEQKAAAAARRDKIKALWATVAEMSDAERVRFADRLGAVTTPEGHQLSLNNTCLLLLQLPTVSVVGGFRQWRESGRCVRKGEKALALWVPISGGKDELAPAGVPLLMGPTADGSPTAAPERRFVLGNVFDISQTEAIDATGHAPAAIAGTLPLAAPGESAALASQPFILC